MFIWVAIIIASQSRIKLATTTSVDNSGLLTVLLPPFEELFNVKVDVIAVGTGKALKLAENGDVDVVLVHAREAEDEFINKGFGVNRRDVMYNDFVIVGPQSDPAKIRGIKNVVDAMKLIAMKKAIFVSRGEESGTHVKEKALWEMAGIKPGGRWYIETGQGMEMTLRVADEKRAYCLTDRSTFIANKVATRHAISLQILTEGDQRLYNLYGIIAVNPELHPHVKYIHSMALIGWITSVRGQKIIAEYKKDGEQLFYPMAIKPKR